MNNIKKIILEEINNFSDISQSNNPDEIFNYIKSLPGKFTLSTRWGESGKLFSDGLNTALNNCPITGFYLAYLRRNKKTTKVLPIPEINSAPYNKSYDLLKITIDYQGKLEPIDHTQPKFFSDWTKNDHNDLNLKLLYIKCFQIMAALLYEDYFNIKFRYNMHDTINNEINLPKDENEFWKLYELINNKESKINYILFFADSIPIIRTIERYDKYGHYKHNKKETEQ